MSTRLPKTIRVSEETHQKLVSRIKWGQTMDEVVLSVLKAADQKGEQR